MSGGSACVALGNGSSVQFEPVANTVPSIHEKRVLMTICGKVHGDAMNCALIPVSCVPAMVASLELAASQCKS